MERSLKLLMIEDNPVEAELLRNRLLEAGRPFELRHVFDVDEALNLLGTLDDNGFDLVILDLNLPKRSGFEFLHAFKASPRTKHTPVLVLTNSQLPSDILRSYSSSASAFLTKPNTLEGYYPIIDVIRSLCEVHAKVAHG